MRLATTLSLTCGTTRRQMEQVLAGRDHVLRSHPRIWPDGITVAFKDLASSALDIEVMAWFKVPTWCENVGLSTAPAAPVRCRRTTVPYPSA
jgi:hypothetical protein